MALSQKTKLRIRAAWAEWSPLAILALFFATGILGMVLMGLRIAA